ncbi:hypothetical protein RFI_23197 [Reticulomyxa filosa]|uniref:Uncharacterized protein n=1 Tax=Reticulomyxa filosa TaxID=46433 RepID=X6MKJ6_RETFI|nr:hypothetical protein RFI_23197 [Reticulomyxa filosa]|eukprot:ETO14171.1 hypothetical protein RFI_23197 [Reticulomyxa filosa]
MSTQKKPKETPKGSEKKTRTPASKNDPKRKGDQGGSSSRSSKKDKDSESGSTKSSKEEIGSRPEKEVTKSTSGGGSSSSSSSSNSGGDDRSKKGNDGDDSSSQSLNESKRMETDREMEYKNKIEQIQRDFHKERAQFIQSINDLKTELKLSKEQMETERTERETIEQELSEMRGHGKEDEQGSDELSHVKLRASLGIEDGERSSESVVYNDAGGVGGAEAKVVARRF